MADIQQAPQSDEQPVFQIQRVYLKEASLEQPNSPAILLEQEPPAVDIQLGVEAQPLAEGISAGHAEMPERAFAPEDVDAILAYLGTL